MNAESARESVLAPEPNEIKWVCGVDLSGPANAAGTAVECFSLQDGRLDYHGSLCPASDAQIVECVGKLAESGAVAIGLVPPLSYKDGGGMRHCDKKLAARLKSEDFNFIGVMTPTMVRMVYLTLRGIGLARALECANGDGVHVVEVHPRAGGPDAGRGEQSATQQMACCRPALREPCWRTVSALRVRRDQKGCLCRRASN